MTTDNRSLDQKIEDNYQAKLRALREAEELARKATGTGGKTGKPSVDADVEKARREYEMAQRVRNERNERNRDR